MLQQLVKNISNEISVTSKNKTQTMDYCKKENLYNSFDIALARLEAFCHETHPNPIFRDIFQDETIVQLTLASHEYHAAVVTQQLLLHF